MADAQTPTPQQENPVALVKSGKPALMELMAAQYGMEPGKFKEVLLKTIFPQDKVATLEQLAMFVIVAHKYKLNPLTKEIYAFPAKGGGIVPVVGIDGWISLVQRQEKYNGHNFTYEWQDGKVGGKLLAVTCRIFRKDLEQPIEMTEFSEECNRDTEPWKKWPRRMLTHKSFIQTARYAFGLGGVYDQDEAERILEGELKPMDGGGFRSEIQMPKRTEQITMGGPTGVGNPPKNTTTYTMAVPHETVNGTNTTTVFIPNAAKNEHTESPEEIAEEDSEATAPVVLDFGFDNAGEAPSIEDIIGKEAATPTAEPEPVVSKKKDTIGAGQAKRIRAIMYSKKARTEAELKELMATFKITDLADYPVNRLNDIVKWAEGN